MVFLTASVPIQYLDVGISVTLHNCGCHSELSSMVVLSSFIKECCYLAVLYSSSLQPGVLEETLHHSKRYTGSA
jgi:hypothetical protein